VLDPILLRLRATDAGFDRELPPAEGWLVFAAAGNQATLWLAASGAHLLVAAAPHPVVEEVGALPGATQYTGALPSGAAGAWQCHDELALDALCRRIALLGEVLPSQPLHRYAAQVARALYPQVHNIPAPHPYPSALDDAPHVGPTEYEAFVRQRIGQQVFRESVMSYWGGRCPLSGVTHPALLRASHAKPWKDATDAERMDVHNGFLLAAHLDAAFDAGLITVTSSGMVQCAAALGEEERQMLGLAGEPRVVPVTVAHAPYLAWHGERVFKRENPDAT
jgi:putative restriction endonuclease